MTPAAVTVPGRNIVENGSGVEEAERGRLYDAGAEDGICGGCGLGKDGGSSGSPAGCSEGGGGGLIDCGADGSDILGSSVGDLRPR
ncbi:hypothetical protein GCM10010170_025240 [Dactylosporangium salmoneum]|uniref:Uncharacterized protein n=1 Tax=Dactylosporangium salmoneum TaxID=53361 RepID=A0ABP5SYG3_9ACTN